NLVFGNERGNADRGEERLFRRAESGPGQRDVLDVRLRGRDAAPAAQNPAEAEPADEAVHYAFARRPSVRSAGIAEQQILARRLRAARRIRAPGLARIYRYRDGPLGRPSRLPAQRVR